MNSNNIKLIFYVFCFSLFNGLYSQSLNYDSIKIVIKNAKSDSVKINSIIDLVTDYKYKDPDLSEKYLKQAIVLAQKNNFLKKEMTCYNELGSISRNKNNYDNATDYYKKALKIAKKTNNRVHEAYVLLNLGTMYEQKGDNKSAVDMYTKTNLIYNETKDSTLFAHLNFSLLTFYSRQKNYAEAEKIGEQLLNYFKEKKDWYNYFTTSSNLALNAYWMNDFKLSEKHYQQALYYSLEVLKDSLSPLETLINYSFLLRDEHKVNESSEKLNLAFQLAKRTNDSCIIFVIYDAKADIEFLNKNHQTCINYCDSALIYSNENCSGYSDFISNVYEKYSKNYELLGNSLKALEYYKKFKIYSDSAMNNSLNEKIVDFQTRYNVQEKESKIELQQAQIEKSKNTIIFIIVTSVFLIVIGVLIYFRTKNKKETEKIKSEKEILELEQKLLLSQMNPHFIFNSLNSINTFLLLNDSKTTSKYLTDFAKLMRLILESSSKELISIENEIKILEYYLKLEQLRLNHKFEFTFDISDEIIEEHSELLIPPLLLQPFVENAILHGVSALDKNGLISIKMFILEKDFIQIGIEDNGVGRTAISQNANSPHHHSMATKISEERIEGIQIKYNKKCSINIVDLYNKEKQPSGTKVIIVLPIIVNEYKE